jgi:hypothetical protein
MKETMRILSLVWICLVSIIEWLINNYKTIIELIITGGILVYFVQRTNEKKKEHRLVVKMKKEISSNLFDAEMILASYLNYLSRAKREHLTEPPLFYKIYLFPINSVLSSGLLFHFDSRFIGFIFEVSSRIQGLELSYETGSPKIFKRNRNYDPFIKTLLLKTVFAFNSIHKSAVYKSLQYKYLTESIVMKTAEDIKIRKGDRLNRKEVLRIWDEWIKAIIKRKDDALQTEHTTGKDPYPSKG